MKKVGESVCGECFCFPFQSITTVFVVMALILLTLRKLKFMSYCETLCGLIQKQYLKQESTPR